VSGRLRLAGGDVELGAGELHAFAGDAREALGGPVSAVLTMRYP
jgi:hypothetical protein